MKLDIYMHQLDVAAMTYLPDKINVFIAVKYAIQMLAIDDDEITPEEFENITCYDGENYYNEQ